jgi:hypothetical protein
MMDQQHDWVRNHLSHLPRPTLPEDVARRLDEAIAAEAGAAAPSSADAGTAAAAGSAAAPIVPQQASRAARRSGTRNRTLLTLGGVAAALVLLAVVDPFAGPAGVPEEPAGIAAAPEQSDAPAEAAGESAPPKSAPPSQAPGSPGGAEGADLDRISGVMTATDTPYSRNQLALQAGEVAAGTAPRGLSDAPAWAAQGSWPAATLNGVRDCLAALPGSADPVVFVDRAQFEGEPALVVARDLLGGALEVFVQDVTCTAEDPAIQYRTTVVP